MTLIVKIVDAPPSMYCRSGARQFFRRYNLNWSKFLREGIPAEQFEATENALVLPLIENARKRQSGR